MLEKERERTTTDHDTGLTRTLTQSKRTPHARRVPARVRLLPRRLEGECSVFIVRGARRILRRAPLGRLPLRRVHSQGIEREDGDTRRRGLARRRARRRRERTTHCSGCPNALPCPETQPVRPQHQIRCAVMQAASCPHSHLGDGQREGDARRLGLGRVRCRAPVVNCSSAAPLVVTWIS